MNSSLSIQNSPLRPRYTVLRDPKAFRKSVLGY